MLSPPSLPPICRGVGGRFGFAPHIHGATKIYFSYDGRELLLFLMGWCVDVCRLIIIMWYIMGGRRVCCIVEICKVDIREQITRGIL